MARYSVSGTLSPDATTADTGEAAGTFSGQPYWTWTNDAGTWYLFLNGANWAIANAFDRFTKAWYGGPAIAGDYVEDALLGTTGTATVTQIDEYYAVKWKMSGEFTILKKRG